MPHVHRDRRALARVRDEVADLLVVHPPRGQLPVRGPARPACVATRRRARPSSAPPQRALANTRGRAPRAQLDALPLAPSEQDAVLADDAAAAHGVQSDLALRPLAGVAAAAVPPHLRRAPPPRRRAASPGPERSAARRVHLAGGGAPRRSRCRSSAAASAAATRSVSASSRLTPMLKLAAVSTAASHAASASSRPRVSASRPVVPTTRPGRASASPACSSRARAGGVEKSITTSALRSRRGVVRRHDHGQPSARAPAGGVAACRP
jgi:hypothetical protein